MTPKIANHHRLLFLAIGWAIAPIVFIFVR